MGSSSGSWLDTDSADALPLISGSPLSWASPIEPLAPEPARASSSSSFFSLAPFDMSVLPGLLSSDLTNVVGSSNALADTDGDILVGGGGGGGIVSSDWCTGICWWMLGTLRDRLELEPALLEIVCMLLLVRIG